MFLPRVMSGAWILEMNNAGMQIFLLDHFKYFIETIRKVPSLLRTFSYFFSEYFLFGGHRWCFWFFCCDLCQRYFCCIISNISSKPFERYLPFFEHVLTSSPSIFFLVVTVRVSDFSFCKLCQTLGCLSCKTPANICDWFRQIFRWIIANILIETLRKVFATDSWMRDRIEIHRIVYTFFRHCCVVPLPQQQFFKTLPFVVPNVWSLSCAQSAGCVDDECRV